MIIPSDVTDRPRDCEAAFKCTETLYCKLNNDKRRKNKRRKKSQRIVDIVSAGID